MSDLAQAHDIVPGDVLTCSGCDATWVYPDDDPNAWGLAFMSAPHATSGRWRGRAMQATLSGIE